MAREPRLRRRQIERQRLPASVAPDRPAPCPVRSKPRRGPCSARQDRALRARSATPPPPMVRARRRAARNAPRPSPRSARFFCQGVRAAAACSAPARTRHPAMRQPRIRRMPRPGKPPGPTCFPTEERVKSGPGPVSRPGDGEGGCAWLGSVADGARRIWRRQPDGISLRSPQGSRFEPSGRSPGLHPTTGWMCPLSGQTPAVPPIFHDNVLARACGRTAADVPTALPAPPSCGVTLQSADRFLIASTGVIQPAGLP